MTTSVESCEELRKSFMSVKAFKLLEDIKPSDN